MKKLFLRRFLEIFLLVGLAGGLVFGFAQFWPLGPDYGVFVQEASRVFSGESQLYHPDSQQYYLMPWSVILIYPLTLVPYNYGQAMLTVFTLVSIVFTTWVIGVDEFNDKKKFVLYLLIVISTLHTFDLIERGNVDAFPILGLGLCWQGLKKNNAYLLAGGVWFLSLKPINVVIPAIVILLLIFKLPRKKQLFAVLPLLISIIVSLPIFGWDWPLRYLKFPQIVPPLEYLQTSLWRAFEFFGLPREIPILLFPLIVVICIYYFVKSRKLSSVSLAAAIATQLFFSPYSLGSHYTMLAPAVLVLASRNWKFLGLWILTLTPILRLFFGFGISWIDNIYPLAAMIGLWKLLLTQENPFKIENLDHDT